MNKDDLKDLELFSDTEEKIDYSEYFDKLLKKYNEDISAELDDFETVNEVQKEKQGVDIENEIQEGNYNITSEDTQKSAREKKSGVTYALTNLTKKIRTKGKKRSFWKGYLIGACGVLVIISGSLIYFWLFLSEYQKCLPVTHCDNIVTAYREYDTDYLRKVCNNLSQSLKEKDNLKLYIKDYLNSEDLFYYEVGAPDADRVKYILKSGKKKVGEIILSKTDDKSIHNFQKYKIESFTAFPLVTYTINAVSNINFTINGKPIDEKYLKEELPVNTGIEKIVGKLSNKKYVIDDLSYIRKLDATAADSGDCIIDYNKETNIYNITNKFDEAKVDEVSKFSEKFLKNYMVFSTKRYGALQPVISDIHPATPLYSKTRTYTNEWGRIYNKDSLKDFKVTNFKCYGLNSYSCDVSANYVIYSDEGEKTYDFFQTFYLSNKDNRWYIADMQPKSK